MLALATAPTLTMAFLSMMLLASQNPTTTGSVHVNMVPPTTYDKRARSVGLHRTTALRAPTFSSDDTINPQKRVVFIKDAFV